MADKLTETVERAAFLAVADALDCFWNAAIGEAHDRQSTTAMDVAAVMATGIAAISTRLKELAALSRPNVDEAERLHSLAKANNTLARMNGQHRDEWRAKAVAYAEALEAIDALPVMEINPSNYDHEDVCELNNNAVQAALIARAALRRSADNG